MHIGELQVKSQEDSWIVVKHVSSGRYLKLGHSEARALLEYLAIHNHSPGQCDTALLSGADLDITPIYQAEELNEIQKAAIFEKFDKWFLTSSSAGIHSKKGIVFHNIARIQLFKFNPQFILQHIPKMVCGIFSGVGMALAAIASLVVLIIARSFRTQILWDMNHLSIDIKGAIVIAILVIMTMCFHEAVHAMSCRFYGGTIPWMGVMLYFFVPCPFCDVSDMYMMKERRKRLWVSMAGVTANVLLGNIVLLIYCFQTAKGISAPELLYFWIGNTLTVLFNFIPLVKLDGYWMLSAITGITNLMDKALFSVRSRFIQTGTGKSSTLDVFLVIYGCLALLFRPAFWGLSIISVRGFLINAGLDKKVIMVLTLGASLAAIVDEARFVMKTFINNGSEAFTLRKKTRVGKRNKLE